MRATMAVVILVQALVLLSTGCEREARPRQFGALSIETDAMDLDMSELPKDTWAVPFLERKPKVDGDLADWKDAQPFALGKAADGVSGRAWLAYDADRLYLAAEITDPAWKNTGAGETASEQSCLIFDFDGLFGTDESSPERMTFAMTRQGPATSWDILRRADPGACVIKQVRKDTWVYEIALSWHDVQPVAPVIGRRFGFDVLYQYLDKDGRARRIRRQEAAGNSPGRRAFGPAALDPMADTVAGTHLYIAPRAFSVGDSETLNWPLLVVFGSQPQGVQLAADVLDASGETVLTSAAWPLDNVTIGFNRVAVSWTPTEAPAERYTLRTSLTDKKGNVLTADSFRAQKTAPLTIQPEYARIKALYDQLVASSNRYYMKDAYSVDVSMQALAEYSDKKLTPETADHLQRIAKRAEAVITAMLRGKDYYADARGWITRGFKSPYDDTLQPYEVFIPKNYDPKKKYPLIVHLHGAGGNDPLLLLDGNYTARYFADPDWEHIQMMPFARGRSGYDGLGLTEVLDTIDLTKQHYSVDADRVYLKGFSMGGAGTWRIALAFPDQFAAANPRAGFTGCALYDKLTAKGAKADWEDALAVAYAPMFLAENANSLPLYLYHGGSDPTIPAENTYRMWDRLTALGGDLGLFVYHHYPHTWAKDMDGVANAFMMRYTRDRFPARVIYRTAHLHFHKAYWVSVERLADPMAVAEIDVLKQSDGSVDVKAVNVEAFALELRSDVIAGNEVNITINGSAVYNAEIPASRVMFLEKVGDSWRVGMKPRAEDLVKQPGLSGPMDDAFFDRVLYVYGTQSQDELMNSTLRALAEERSGLNEPNRYLSRARHGFYPFKADVEVTEEDLARCHLVLIGGPAENLVTRRIAERLPVKFASGRFTFRGKEYAAPDDGIKFIYPNPISPGRYVIVTAANAVPGYEKTSDLRRRIPDWVLTNREGIKDAGFFTNRWE